MIYARLARSQEPREKHASFRQSSQEPGNSILILFAALFSDLTDSVFAVHGKKQTDPEAGHIQTAERQLVIAMKPDGFAQQWQLNLILHDGREADDEQVQKETAARQQKTVAQLHLFSDGFFSGTV
jgi:hypothetical protein